MITAATPAPDEPADRDAGDVPPAILPDPASTQPLTARGRRTRNALIHAAREVFDEQGFQEAKIADIPRRANMSYGTFYTYFDSKDAIFREVVNTATGELFLASRSGLGTGGSPVERIRAATTRYMASYARNAGVLRVIEEVAFRDPYFHNLLSEIRFLFVQRITAGIQRLQDEGLADATLDPELTAKVLGGMVEQAARHAFLFGEASDEAAMVDTLTRLWARGIGLNPDE